jgi:hypothetical protein
MSDIAYSNIGYAKTCLEDYFDIKKKSGYKS